MMTCERISNEEIIELIRAQCIDDRRKLQCVENVLRNRYLDEENRRAALWQVFNYPVDMAVYFYGDE